MTWILRLLAIAAILTLLLAGCSNSAPDLAEKEQPTLVFVYTDG